MQEIEILFELQDSPQVAASKLNSFKAKPEQTVIDQYFHFADKPKLSPNADGQLSACLRIRSANNKHKLTYKHDHFDTTGNWSHSDEFETLIDSATTITHILKELGLTELVTIQNRRLYFDNPDYEIVIEDVTNLGYFIEIERKHNLENPVEQVDAEKVKIRQLMQDLGINVGKELNAGKPELMLRKNRI